MLADRVGDWLDFYQTLFGFTALPVGQHFGVLPGGTLLMTERDRARLSTYDGSRSTVDFPENRVWVSGETGLMSLEVDPRFGTNRRFYTCSGWVKNGGGHDVRADRAARDPRSTDRLIRVLNPGAVWRPTREPLPARACCKRAGIAAVRICDPHVVRSNEDQAVSGRRARKQQ